MTDLTRMEGSLLLLWLLAMITGTQANAIPEINMSLIYLREDLQKGAFAFQITATDADADVLHYSIIGPNAIYFNVNSGTGEVTIRTPLDREAMNVVIITILVNDGSYPASKDITIILEDANDNKPIFTDAPYNIKVSEDTPVDTVLFTVTAIDVDIGHNAVVTYIIDEVSPSGETSLFSIGQKNGSVTLAGKLNYNGLSTFYRLRINASDRGIEPQSSIAFAFITVVDVPDLDPQFLSLPYTGVVEEHSPPGHPVLTVSAIDRDAGIKDTIHYSIESSNADGLFAISPVDGTITVQGDIDREVLKEINYQVILDVKATEANPSILGYHANTSAKVEIAITDINDNKPRFYSCAEDPCVETSLFTGEIFEHSLGAVPISITVIDLDQGSNGRVELSLDGPAKEIFSVAPELVLSQAEIQILVRSPLDVDYERNTSMVLQVIAKDPGNIADCCSTATVTIQIKDTNDNSPVFPEDTYSLTLAEHSPNGTTIGTITAEDPDTMDIDNISYKLLPDRILRYFGVEPTTGRVFVSNSALIDREVNSLHTVTLQARDTKNNIGTTVLVITLTDINDQPPVINRESYVEFVREGDGGHLRLSIQATDADDPELQNSEVRFAIVDDSEYSANFTISTIHPNTGVLENNGPLDREAIDPLLNGKIELNVTATDMGTPALSTWVSVTINVEDINDNSPMFKEASYQFVVPEGKTGVFVGSVFAEDLDQTQDHHWISFRIDGGMGKFFIRTERMEDGVYRGDIRVDPDVELDYEDPPTTFSLRVEAEDLGQRMANVTVKVIVEDLNDERPVFNPVLPLNVPENTTIQEPVGRFEATDADSNHSLVYELVSTRCLCQGSLGPCEKEWFILDPNGNITLNQEFMIDYENCTKVEMEAQVKDIFTEQGADNSRNTGILVIHIDDINDNDPEFIAPTEVLFVVHDRASEGSLIASVTVKDRDSVENKLTCQVLDVQFHSNNQYEELGPICQAICTQEGDKHIGRIHSLEDLRTDRRGSYLVTVEATDGGGRSTTTVLEIFTVDKSFKIELRFSFSPDEVKNKLDEIKLALKHATNATIDVVKIREEGLKTRVFSKTIMEAYFVNPNGSAINFNEVNSLLSAPEHFLMLKDLGLLFIETGVPEDPKTDPFIFYLLGLVAALIIVLAAMTTSLVCTRRTYQTKLKAAKAMKSAVMVTAESQKSGPVVPGTNKYTMEGANPVLNLNIDMATDLGFDEDGSNTDRVSLNSLDYNADTPMSEKDNMQMMIIQEEEEEENGEPDYTESLGAALAQRDKRRDSDSRRLTFNNPAFSTTDL